MLKTIQIGQQLTKAEMREVKGGLAAADGCCFHTGDWSNNVCGVSKSEAQWLANYHASETGESSYWCCASC